jgi:Ricin-type beta-trefoil lectin domain
MKIRLFSMLFTLALAMVLPRPLVAQVYETISNKLSDKCLEPVSTVAGAAILIQPCSNLPIQQWTEVNVKSPYVHYMNQFTKMCLDARGGAQNHTPVQLWPCDQISNEYWVPNKTYNVNSPVLTSGVANSYPKFCLDLPSGLTNAGITLQIYECNGTPAQQWTWAGSL